MTYFRIGENDTLSTEGLILFYQKQRQLKTITYCQSKNS